MFFLHKNENKAFFLKNPESKCNTNHKDYVTMELPNKVKSENRIKKFKTSYKRKSLQTGKNAYQYNVFVTPCLF